MPSSDYANAVGGGLKLKGAKDAGVKKHKKKKPAKQSPKASPLPEDGAEKDHEQSALQRLLADEEQDGVETTNRQQEDDMKVHGKTEAQRRHEERRRKRVCNELKHL